MIKKANIISLLYWKNICFSVYINTSIDDYIHMMYKMLWLNQEETGDTDASADDRQYMSLKLYRVVDLMQHSLIYASKSLTLKVLNFWKFYSYCCLKPLWLGIPSHCASIVVTSTLRINTGKLNIKVTPQYVLTHCLLTCQTQHHLTSWSIYGVEGDRSVNSINSIHQRLFIPFISAAV